MKKVIGLIIRFWIDCIAVLVVLTAALALLDAKNPNTFAFSFFTLPLSAVRCSPYAAAIALIFTFPRLNKLQLNRALGYAILFTATLVPFSCLAIFLPLIPSSPAPASTGIQALIPHVLTQTEEADIWISSIEGRNAHAVVSIANSGDSPLIRLIPSVPYAPERSILLVDGRPLGRRIPEAKKRSIIAQCLDFANTGSWIVSLAQKAFVDRLAVLLTLATALAFLWPISRLGSWPMVSFALSWVALAGVFALVSLFKSQTILQMLLYVDIHVPETVSWTMGCALFSLFCIAFDLVFIPSNKGRL